MNKKIVALVLATAVSVSCLAGCGNNANKESSQTSETKQTVESSVSSETASSSEPEVEKVMEFEYFAPLSDPYPETSPVYDLLMEKTGITVNFSWCAKDGAQTLLSSRVADKDLPDVIGNWKYDAYIEELIQDGLIVPLTDLLKEKMPNYYNLLTEEDITYVSNVNDGENYGFGYVQELKGQENWIIRQDWLDKLNMPVPETWDQLVDTWKAFRDNDMNGNGKKDEVAFMLTGTNGSRHKAIKNIFGMASNGSYSVVDGEYLYDPENPNYMEYLDALRMLYEEDLIALDYITVDSKTESSLMGAGLVGTTYASASTAANFGKTLSETIPEAYYACISPIEGPHGDRMIAQREKVANRVWITTAAVEEGKLDTILEFFNYVFSEEGILITNYGIEGESYKMVNNEPVIQSPYVDKFANARGYGIVPSTIAFLLTADAFLDISYAGQSEADMDKYTLAGVEGLKVVNEGYYYAMPLKMSTEASAEYADLIQEQTVLEDKYITGKISKDDYTKEYEALKKAGLSEVIEQAKAAYKNVTGK